MTSSWSITHFFSHCSSEFESIAVVATAIAVDATVATSTPVSAVVVTATVE